MDSGTGRFKIASGSSTGVVYLPASFVRDSRFPLKNGDEFKVQVDEKGRIIIQKKQVKTAVRKQG